MSFGENLQAARRKKGLSQEELAGKLEVSRQAVSRWEMNEGYPETEKLIALAKALDVSLDSLLLSKTEEPSTAAGGKGRQSAPPNDQPEKQSLPGHIMIHSANLKTAASCYKFSCVKVAFPTKKEPKCALVGVDGHSFWGDSQVQLGWYADEESVQREIEAIMAAMARGEFFYLLQYDVKVKEHALGVEMVEE